MSVYIDPELAWPKSSNWPYNVVTHMYADTPEELHAFAKKIGLKRIWCSDHTHHNSRLLHYDLNHGRRLAAIKAGAIQVGDMHKRKYMNPAFLPNRLIHDPYDPNCECANCWRESNMPPVTGTIE
jgi:hypothetical protein